METPNSLTVQIVKFLEISHFFNQHDIYLGFYVDVESRRRFEIQILITGECCTHKSDYFNLTLLYRDFVLEHNICVCSSTYFGVQCINDNETLEWSCQH